MVGGRDGGGFLFSFASWLWWSSSEVMLIEFEPIVANILTQISVCGSERSTHTLLMNSPPAGCSPITCLENSIQYC